MHNKIQDLVFHLLPNGLKNLPAMEMLIQDNQIANEIITENNPPIIAQIIPVIKKLLGDHFMILAKNIFGYKRFVVMVFMCMMPSCAPDVLLRVKLLRYSCS